MISCYILVTATLVSKANASGNQEEIQDAVSQALIVGFYISLVGSKYHQVVSCFISYFNFARTRVMHSYNVSSYLQVH